jgi:large repetitive protein
VPSSQDTIDEGVSESYNLSVGGVATTGTLTDDDAAPTVATVSSPTVTEGSSLVYTVALSNASGSATTFAYTLGGGSAVASDFGAPTFSNGVTLAGGILTVPAGVTSFTVTVPTTQDVVSEANETVPLAVGGVTGTGTINDNDPLPSISIGDVTITEGTASTPATANFTVTLSAASGQTVTVGYNTSNGTATAGTDYVATSGTLSFAPGVTSLTISVPITNDTADEPDESFNVNLVTPTNATIADPQGVGTILDNDASPVLDLDANNSSGSAGANFTVTYNENGPALSIADTDVSLSDADSTTLTGATITLTNAQAGDVLAVGTLPAGITATVVGNVVTLSGAASLASYQTALRAVTFGNSSDAPSTTARTITVVVTDGVNASNTATTTINVVAANDLPAGINRAVTTGEDVPYRFSSADFRMNDAEDGANSAAAAVRLDSLPANGTLTLNGVAVTTGQVLTAAQISSLTFTPAANASGATYASFNFSVRDSSGAFDPSPNALTIAVSPRVDLSVRDVQHWTFNEGSGTTTTNIYPSVDQTGTRTDGISGGANLSPTFTASGHEGSGMQFNGIWSGTSSSRDGGYVALASSVTDPLRGNGAGGGNASLVFWIRTTQTGGGIGWDSPSVIGMENNGGTIDVQWGWISSTGRIGFGIADEPGVLSANPVNDGTWHNVAITHNFATGATEVWVDGVLSNSGSVLPGAIIPNRFLGIGVTADDGATRDRYLNGTLDDVRIYDRTLTATQIQAIYAAENNNLGASAVLDNDGGPVRFTVAANDFAQLTVTGAPVGSSLTDGTNTVAITTAGQTVDVTGWNLSELAVTGLGTNSALLAVTATGATAGDSATQFINIVTGSSIFNGTTAANVQAGSAAADFISGGGGDDNITANGGDDRVFGGTGNDTISGGAGNDVIVGGAGNDIMTGGAGADVFQWQLADRGTGGAPATDTITDFDPASRAAGGDVLDLRDLLVGENRSGGTGNLDSYLDFDTVSTPGSTIIRISSSGGFAGGTYAAGQEDERITLTGVDLRASFGLGAAATDAQIIQELINRNKIVTDGP